MSNYFYMNDFPLTVAKGGKEEQLRMVSEFVRVKFTGVYDIYDKSAPKIVTGDTLHCFGDNPLFFHFPQYENVHYQQGQV